MVFARTVILASLLLVIGLLPANAQTGTVSGPVMVIAGEEEIVFDWTSQRCDNEDIPDLPARAFRDADGQTQLIATHYVARRSIGPDLDHLSHSCAILLRPNQYADPALYSDKEWIASVYTEDGATIYVVLHNEYQGHTHGGQCPSGEYFNCWYNALTMAVSTDSGRTYTRAGMPPDHLVASLPYRYEAEAGPYGVFEASNMIDGGDGYVYMFARVDDYRSPRQWTCLLRTDNVATPDAWWAWDGEGFNLRMSSPYLEEITNPEALLCAPVNPEDIGSMNASITFNTYLNRYVLVGISADTLEGHEVWGVYYAFSDDLLHWSRRQLLFEAELPWTYTAGDANPVLYPSLLDPDSDSRNFDTSDEDAYLYFTRFNSQNNQQMLDRDLIRVPVQFFRSQEEARNPETIAYLSLSVDTGTHTASGTLTNSQGEAIRGATIEFTARPLDDGSYEFATTGQVPENATRALVGYRVNTECGCTGTADFTLYETRYAQADEINNRVPNADFGDGMRFWNATGSGDYALVASDRDSGQMLRVVVGQGQTASLNSEVFSVEGGATYTITYVAPVNPATADSGYFALIFLDGSGEIARVQTELRPNIIAPRSAITDERGAFEIELDAAGRPYILTAAYAGDHHYLRTDAEIVVNGE